MDGESGDTATTVMFVDLVRFTSLTDVHGDVVGADIASALRSIVESSLVDGTRMIKTLGDGVLLTASNPVVGVRMVFGIVEGLHDLGIGIDARSGVDHGPVVERDGDVFGSTVNLASRASSLAQPGHLVVTRAVAEAVGVLDIAVKPMGIQPVTGFVDPVELFEIDLCAHDGDWLSDPVCGMRVLIEDAVGRQVHNGDALGFCSIRCAEIFSRAPQRFA